MEIIVCRKFENLLQVQIFGQFVVLKTVSTASALKFSSWEMTNNATNCGAKK